jgi:hypothetical protein
MEIVKSWISDKVVNELQQISPVIISLTTKVVSQIADILLRILSVENHIKGAQYYHYGKCNENQPAVKKEG